MDNNKDYYGQMMAQGAVNATGAVILQSEMTIGGQRHVFVDLPGAVKEAFRRPPIGGVLKNPFPGPAKIYAGDLIEHSLGFADNSGGTIKVLKSYEVAKATTAATDTAIYITRDGYHHIPFVGDNLMVGPKDFKTRVRVCSLLRLKMTCRTARMFGRLHSQKLSAPLPSVRFSWRRKRQAQLFLLWLQTRTASLHATLTCRSTHWLAVTSSMLRATSTTSVCSALTWLCGSHA